MKKWVTLSRIENLYGEKIIERELMITPEKVKLIELNCYSSLDEGLGTCRCVLHDTYEEREISKERAKDLIVEALEKGEITREEAEEALTFLK